MSDVVDLEEWRAARPAPTPRAQEVADAIPDHPALRYVAGDEWWWAHRRSPATRYAACGAPGTLLLAANSVPLCPACYPPPQP